LNYRRKCCSIFWVALSTVLLTSSITACTSDKVGHSVSKVYLGLGLSSIPDPKVKEAATDAASAVEWTLLQLVNSSLSAEEVSAKLKWDSAEPLLLPPENWNAADMKARSSLKRYCFVFWKGDDWQHEGDFVSFTAEYREIARNSPAVRERQTYRKTAQGWRLVRQQRLEN